MKGTDSTAPASSAPPNPAMNPAMANARSFDDATPTVYAAALSALSRTAMVVRPMPDRRSRLTTTNATTSTARHT